MENAKALPRIGTKLTVHSRHGPIIGTVRRHTVLAAFEEGWEALPDGEAIVLETLDGESWMALPTDAGGWFAAIPFSRLMIPALMRHVLGDERDGR